MAMRSRQAINAETLEQASQEVDYPLPPQTVRRRIMYCLSWLIALVWFQQLRPPCFAWQAPVSPACGRGGHGQLTNKAIVRRWEGRVCSASHGPRT